MPTANGDTLPYGQDHLVPTDSPAAWGARLIVTQDGYVDFVPDRHGAAGAEKDRLFGVLENLFPLFELKHAISLRLKEREMDTRQAQDFVLLDAPDLEVHANTNASAGYCYVTAWLKP